MNNNKWNPGDIVMGFGNPITHQTPLGEVRLHTFLQESRVLELWLVEYLDQPEQFYELWIRKKDYDEIKKNTSTRVEEKGDISTETKI